VSVIFLLPLKHKSWLIPRLRHDRFLPNPSQFIIYLSCVCGLLMMVWQIMQSWLVEFYMMSDLERPWQEAVVAWGTNTIFTYRFLSLWTSIELQSIISLPANIILHSQCHDSLINNKESYFIYWVLFSVKHNNIPINSLTYHFAQLGLLVVQCRYMFRLMEPSSGDNSIV
jgi:hypothetical protein